jgi:phospholipid-binding lipoprotein MlaA
VIRPVAEGYVHAVPHDLREVIRNVLDNLNQPLILANCLLQTRWRDAGRTAERFAANSTIGIAGLGDPATDWKLPRETGDFGQTLARWGVAEGPYLVVPLFGPTSVRDGVGRGVDTYLDPWYYVPAHPETPKAANAARVAVGGIDERAQNLDTLDVLQRQSIDYYAALRSLYRQHRAAEISGQSAQAAPQTLPPANFYDDPGK